MDHASSGELLSAWRSGDVTALEVLVQRHQAPLIRHARALLGAGGAYEDAVQDAFLKLAQKPPELPRAGAEVPDSGDAHLAAWLHRVTRNHCMDLLRADARRREREGAAASADVSEGGLGEVERADTQAAVERELTRLPVDQREILVLRLFEEKSYAEIAAITGRKIGTVGWLVSVGLKELGRRLEPVLQAETPGHAPVRTPLGEN